jgi:Mce-associated membrane protein
VTSDARVRPPEEDDAVSGHTAGHGGEDDGADAATPGTADPDRPERSGVRPSVSVPLVPVLATLLVLLLATAAFLGFTRPDPSAIRTADYVQALQAARSGIVDVTSFDHLTLDDDIEQIRRVTTGDLREEAVAELEDNRQQIVEAESIVNTEVVGAGVLRADGDSAAVLMVIRATQQSTASEQAQVAPYRVQVELTKENGRWVLSGITGR